MDVLDMHSLKVREKVILQRYVNERESIKERILTSKT